MEYPYTTLSGFTYEYDNISRWLAKHSTDPCSNQRLTNKTLVPNHALRSQIQQWYEKHPDAERNTKAVKPPSDGVIEDTSMDGTRVLQKILRFNGEKTRDKIAAKFPLQQKFEAFGHQYQFYREVDKRKKPRILIQCDNQSPVPSPGKSVFATTKGLVFYDSNLTMETRVVQSNPCQYKNSCTKDNCRASHVFVCKQGAVCIKNGCKFLHPPEDSVVPLQKR